MQVRMAMMQGVTIKTIRLGFVIEAALQMLSVDESLLPTGEIAPPMECMIQTLHRMILDAVEMSVVAIVAEVIEAIEMSSVGVHHLGIDPQAQAWSRVQCNKSSQEHRSQLVMITTLDQIVSKVTNLLPCSVHH